MTHLTRRDALKLTAGGLAAAGGIIAMPSILRAAAYPTRPINVIVPFATGGYNDRLSRAFAPISTRSSGSRPSSSTSRAPEPSSAIPTR